MDYRKDYIDVCNVIGGEWSRPATEERLPVYNPSTGEEIGNVPLTPAEEVKRAVDVAAEAFTQWRQVDAGRRCKYLFAIRNKMEANSARVMAWFGLKLPSG